ncbi:MAG TPA: isocitrate lyase, partial [Cryomorphaceae bacterium]|nr:isocitrate lyase [Cryomorphaceae bacterium]
GAYDGMSARIVQAAGAEIVYATGGGIARSTGIPDMGMLNPFQIEDRLTQMVDAVEIPIIGDFDTGYGNVLNALHELKRFERTGIAGFHIEDQTFPKRCGHLDNKTVVPVEELVTKIRAIKDNQLDPDFVVIARTDSLAIEGVNSAIERMHKYMEAGADVAFVEAPTSLDELKKISGEFKDVPLLYNMFWSGKSPVLEKKALEELGFNLMIAPGDLQRAAMHTMKLMAEEILKVGHTEKYMDMMASFQDREEAVNTPHYMQLDDKYSD